MQDVVVYNMLGSNHKTMFKQLVRFFLAVLLFIVFLHPDLQMLYLRIRIFDCLNDLLLTVRVVGITVGGIKIKQIYKLCRLRFRGILQGSNAYI